MSIAAIASRWRKPWPAGDALLVAAVLALATGLGLLLQDSLSLASLALLYVLAVVIASQFASLAAALACTAAALALLNFFFVPPRVDLRIDGDENLAALAAMLAVALVINRRSTALRREASAARASEKRAAQLQTLATALAGAADEADVHAISTRVLAEASSAGEGIEHARAIHALSEQALQRVRAGATARAAEDRARWRRAQNTFLAGLSHDLRTPLSPIVTAASSLLTQRGKLGPGEQQRLAEVILAEAAHLATLTENAQHLARLEDAGALRLDWQSVEEIVGAVLRRVRQRAPGRQIAARVPAGLPLVRADAVLLAQVLDNLLDNALRYTMEPVELVVTHSQNCLQLSVQDRGAGISADALHALFEPQARGDRSSARGGGLGLVVGRAVARAHGGELSHAQRQGGGSVFTLRLPVDPQQPVLEPA